MLARYLYSSVALKTSIAHTHAHFINIERSAADCFLRGLDSELRCAPTDMIALGVDREPTSIDARPAA